MSPAVDLTTYHAVILDFDGPMCNVFAGYPASTIAEQLKDLLAVNGWHHALPATDDPHQIIRCVQLEAPRLVPAIEAALTASEVAAVDSATETPELAGLLAELREAATPVAIASNNNADAIRRWLNHHGYEIEHVVGRDPDDPSKMKPAPEVLIKAMNLLQTEPRLTAFIGDAVTDAEAASTAGCAFIAFANKPVKLERFASLGCEAIVTSLDQLLKSRSI